MKEIRHLEMFAGIGGFRKAFDLFAKDYGICHVSVGYSEIDSFARHTYQSNFDTKKETDIGDIKEFVLDERNIRKLEDFHILTAGFPCQPFSMMGKQQGFKDHRGNIFYNIVEILRYKKPKYILLENVRNLRTHDKGRTYSEIERSLRDDLDQGYKIFPVVFNTSDFGLPQHRRRVYIFGIRVDQYQQTKEIVFNEKAIKEFYRERIQNSRVSIHKYRHVLDGVLAGVVDEKYYLSERIKPTILAHGSKNYYSKSEINQLIARPLTATMVKMHRANQDNYYSDEFIQSREAENCHGNCKPVEILNNKRIRRLTPLEALKLQGFDEDFYNNAKASGLSDHQLYKQAGNAVSVNTVYSILYYLFNSGYINSND